MFDHYHVYKYIYNPKCKLIYSDDLFNREVPLAGSSKISWKHS